MSSPVRGVLPCCILDNYFAVMLGSVGGHYRPEDVQIGNYAGALEALNGGVTTLLDWSHINNTPDHSDAAIQGLKDAGIRAIYAHGVPTGSEWWMFSELDHPEDVRPSGGRRSSACETGRCACAYRSGLPFGELHDAA